jgi:hypothetical protein
MDHTRCNSTIIVSINWYNSLRDLTFSVYLQNHKNIFVVLMEVRGSPGIKQNTETFFKGTLGDYIDKKIMLCKFLNFSLFCFYVKVNK